MTNKIEVHNYGAFTNCPKCGIYYVYRNAITEYDLSKDLLHRTCLRCGFRWWESPIDYATNDEYER